MFTLTYYFRCKNVDCYRTINGSIDLTEGWGTVRQCIVWPL